jgi:hypothetical protein
MLERVNSDPTFLKRIVTGDETWDYEIEMQASQKASEWRLPTEPKPKKPCQSRSKVKVKLTVSFDCRGVMHSKFMPEGQTVNMELLFERIQKARFVEKNSCILHTYIPLTLYPQRGCRGISNIPPKHPRFTKIS